MVFQLLNIFHQPYLKQAWRTTCYQSRISAEYTPSSGLGWTALLGCTADLGWTAVLGCTAVLGWTEKAQRRAHGPERS